MLRNSGSNALSASSIEGPITQCPLRSPGTLQICLRPSLDEVLANTAPPPYNLSAFRSYLFQNHCLETLEFLLEANRYCETYNSFVARGGDPTATTNASENEYLCMFGQLLLTTYVLPEAPREVNLSVNVRDALLRKNDMSTPLLPKALEPAMKSIHDLVEDSIFDSFLNSRLTSLHRESALGPSARDDMGSYPPVKVTKQPRKPVPWRANRPPLTPLGRTWTWPLWRHRAN